jgi:photosystem II stability/assembly factor-like uncharacterized protein
VNSTNLEGRVKLRNVTLLISILAVAGLVTGAVAQKSAEKGFRDDLSHAKRPIDEATVIRHRSAWFYQQRAYPLPRIPAFARQRAWNDFRQMQQHQRQVYGEKYGPSPSTTALSSSVLAAVSSWVPIGPQPTSDFFSQPGVSGRVTAMVVDPCDTTGNTVFLGGALGGLWKTTDGGTHWAVVGDQTQLPSLAVGSVAIPPSPSCVGTPSTTNTVYVGTGEENFAIDSYYGAGILKCVTADGSSYACTTDNTLGQFNSQSNPLTVSSGGAFVGGIAIDPQNANVMLAAVQGFSSTLPSGIWCSADGGSNWTHVLPSVTRVVGTGVAFDKAGFGYAALGNIDGGSNSGATTLNGVYKTSSAFSSNCSAGSSFTQLGGLANIAGAPSKMGRIALAVSSSSTSSSSSDILYAAIASAADISSSLLGVFKSTDGGANWAALSGSLVTNSGGFCNNQCFYDLTITIDPHNSSVVMAGGAAPGNGATIIQSTDGGNTWADVSGNANGVNGPHVDAHAIAFKANGSAVYVGTDGGAWSAANPEANTSGAALPWTNLNQTLALTQFYPGLSNNPGGWQYRSFGGTQDNGAQQYSGTATWNNTLACGDGGVTLVDPLVSSTVYTECAYIPNFLLGIEKSVFNGDADNVNGATSFFEASNGIDPSDSGSFIPPMAMDSANPQTLYFGTYRVWQTSNGAGSWQTISPDVTGAASDANCGVNYSCDLTAIAVSASNPDEVVTGSNISHVSVTLNASQGSSSTWTDVTGVTLPPRSITQVAVDPNNANTLYATFSGFSNFVDNAGHVFQGTMTTAGGTPAVVWTDISNSALCTAPAGALPNIPVNDIVVDPDQAGRLYVATDVGVLLGTLETDGACWQPLGGGLPNTAILSLTLSRASRTLIAGTHGRSAWALALGDQQPFHLETLQPASADAGATTALSMTLIGQGFTSGSTVNWTVNGTTPSNCTATVTNESSTTTITGETATQLNANVSAGCLATGGVADVSVSDSTQTPSSTNSLPFTVTSAAPSITSISPTSASAPASSPLNISITGKNFLSNTTVDLTQLQPFDSSCVTTKFNSSTSITATVQANCLQYGGVFFVTANNPQPGGGASAACPTQTSCITLTVTGPPPSNDNFSAAAAASNGSAPPEDTSGATVQSTDPIPPCTASDNPGPANGGAANSVWFKYTPTASGNAEVDTIGSSYDTILSAWQLTSSAAVPPPPAPFAAPRLPILLLLMVVVTFLALAFGRGKSPRRRVATALALALLVGSLAFEGACGGGGGGGGGSTPPPSTTLSAVACNDDIVLGVNRVSRISNLAVTANTTYYFMISSYEGDGGKLTFNITGP